MHSLGAEPINSGVENVASKTRDIALSYFVKFIFFDLLNGLSVTGECDGQTFP